MPATILVAHDRNRVIGQYGMIPWRLPDDLREFKELTTGGLVIMGRVTWESICHSLRSPILPGRINVVVSRDWAELSEKHILENTDLPLYFTDMSTAMAIAQKGNPDKLFVIGGSQIYAAALEADVVEEIRTTLVPGEHEGDAFFPELSDEWQSVGCTYHHDRSVIKYKKVGKNENR